MKKLTQFLFLIFIALIVIVGGFLGGRHLSNINKPLSTEEAQLIEAQQAEKIAVKEQARENKRLERELKKIKNKADYSAAPSSYGPFIKIQYLNVTFGDDEALAYLDKEKAADLGVAQNIILYDKENENNAMPLGGMIRYFNNEDGRRKVVIKLPDGTNTEFLSNKVGVITQQTISSQRIPLSALIKNKQGDDIIWIAKKIDDTQFNLTPTKIIKADENEAFFIPDGFDIDPYELIITNPDKFIKEDKQYTLFITSLNAPVMNPIDQAWREFEALRYEQQYQEMIQAAQDCFNGKQAAPDPNAVIPTGASSNVTNPSAAGCGATTNKDDVMFEIFKSLTTPANSSGASGSSGGCGQPASACGQ